MDEGMTEDPGCTADATTEEEDMVPWSMATVATEPGGTTTWTWTIPKHERTAQATENHEAGGTPGERLDTGRTKGCTNAATAVAPTTVTRTPEAATTAAWSLKDG